MRLLVLSESADHVSCRYRVRAFGPSLRQQGWETVELSLDRAGPGFISVLQEARRSDAVLVQRRLLSAAKLHMLRRCARRLIYDVDDAVFLRDSNSAKSTTSWQRLSRFRAMARACDAVIAGNDFLAENAARWMRRGSVAVIPTCVDPTAYPPPASLRHDDALRIAWIGSSSTLPSLYEIAGALQRASDAMTNLELHVVCDSLPELPGVQVILHPWTEASEASDLAGCDVGISWLPDHPWSRGKCGLKALQYMAARLPVIVNAIGVHRQFVTNGVHGLVVERPADVCDAVLRLARSPALRKQMGSAGRQRVEADFSVQKWSSDYAAIVQSVADRPASRAAS